MKVRVTFVYTNDAETPPVNISQHEKEIRRAWSKLFKQACSSSEGNYKVKVEKAEILE